MQQPRADPRLYAEFFEGIRAHHVADEDFIPLSIFLDTAISELYDVNPIFSQRTLKREIVAPAVEDIPSDSVQFSVCARCEHLQPVLLGLAAFSFVNLEVVHCLSPLF